MGKVNVQARIIARKVTFSFMYAHIFLFKTKKTEKVEKTKQAEKAEETKNLLFDQTDFFGLKNKTVDDAVKSDDSQNSLRNKLEQAKIKLLDRKTSKKDFFVYSVEDLSKNYLEETAVYILDQFFSYNKTPIIDMDYFLEVASKLFDYKQEVFDMINKFTSTFSIERMDTSDQCIFVIAYTEWKVLGTPKEVLLNEMIELAKRYGDEGSPKLVNGILHKIIS